MFDKDQSIVCFVAVVRTVKVNLIVLLIGCTLQAGLFLSCERTRRAGSDQGPAMLRERVNALQFETLGPVDLGNASAAPTDNTEYVIAHGQEAVPPLVEALKDTRKPKLVGYAAYCLRRIGSNQGQKAAATSYDQLTKKGDQISLEERFARSELKNYLEQVGQTKP